MKGHHESWFRTVQLSSVMVCIVILKVDQDNPFMLHHSSPSNKCTYIDAQLKKLEVKERNGCV